MKAQIKEFLLRVLPVMIGVYLGFVLSNWNEGQKRKHLEKLATKSLENDEKMLKFKSKEIKGNYLDLF